RSLRKYYRFRNLQRIPRALNSAGVLADPKGVRTKTRRAPAAPPKPRFRSRYDHRWWGEAPEPDEGGRSYWVVTRRPLPCLAFVAPLLLAYEIGVLWLGGNSAEALRTGADAWMRQALAGLGLTDQWLLPLLLIITLLGWHAYNPRDWRFA